METILEIIKICKNCGGNEFYKSGKCAPCRRKYKLTYYKKNKEKQKNHHLRWAELNTDKVKSGKSAWKQKNKEKESVYRQTRRAKKSSSGGVLSHGISKKLLLLQNNKCAICKTSLIQEAYHLDHIMPLALCGENTDFNIQLLCPTCNLSKGAKHPIDYMQSRGFLL